MRGESARGNGRRERGRSPPVKKKKAAVNFSFCLSPLLPSVCLLFCLGKLPFINNFSLRLSLLLVSLAVALSSASAALAP